ncbi:hypothetical protein JVU11DRAFT_9135 [Chiua virens]|nr:hypothetical protein JVU11DRAFT_9135 [Chiua virens]
MLNDNLNLDGTHLSMPPSSAPNLSAPAAPTDEPHEIRAIWGTTVNLAETMKLFREFLRGFKPKYRALHDQEKNIRTMVFNSPEGAEVVLYETQLRTMRQIGQTNLNLDMLQKYPQEVIPAVDQVLKDLMLEIADEDQQAGVEGMHGEQGDEEIADIRQSIQSATLWASVCQHARTQSNWEWISRFYRYDIITLNSSADTDKVICIKGLVIRATPVIPDMKVAFFRCLVCSHAVQVEIDRGKIEEPGRCPRDVCTSVGTMSLIHNRCEFADQQVIRLQETPDARFH